MAIAGAAVLAFGSSVGLTGKYTHLGTSERFDTIHPAAAIGGYFLMLFAIAHWPPGRRGATGPRIDSERTHDTQPAAG